MPAMCGSKPSRDSSAPVWSHSQEPLQHELQACVAVGPLGQAVTGWEHLKGLFQILRSTESTKVPGGEGGEIRAK